MEPFEEGGDGLTEAFREDEMGELSFRDVIFQNDNHDIAPGGMPGPWAG